MNKKYIVIILLFLIFNLIGVYSAYAMNNDFETVNLSDKDRESYLAYLNITLLDNDEKKVSIDCFDISDQGNVAVGSYGENIIYVYNSNGEFKYGYSFYDSGIFGIKWDGDNLIYFSYRGNFAALIDQNAVCIEMQEIPDSDENLAYWRHTLFKTERISGRSLYELRNNMGAFNFLSASYAQLIKTDQNGIQTVIYDVSDLYNLKVLIICFGIILFVIIAIIVLVKQFKKLNPKTK